MTEQIAEIIRLHRRAARLSRIELAELAGVGKTVIYDIEKERYLFSSIPSQKFSKF